MDNCLFCLVARKEISAKIVYEDERMIAFYDINPRAPIHILLIPKKHLDSVASLLESDRDLAGEMIIRCAKIAKEKGILKSGFRLTTNTGSDAGQVVPHLHFHLLGGKKLGPIG